MMKLMIIDDEAIIRKGIRTSIDWEKYGVVICGEAKNGRTGLEKARELKPDIVLVDIRMPIMDGLEFSEKMSEMMPDTRIVILSGYDYFEYARKALKIGVSEYLLKPVGAEDLVKLIAKLTDDIENQRQKKENMTHIKKVVHENLDLIRGEFMLDILRSGKSCDDRTYSKAKKLEIPFSGPKYRIVTIAIDDLAFFADISDPSEREWILFSTRNITLEIIESIYPCVVFDGDFDSIIVFLNVPTYESDTLLRTLQKLQIAIRKYIHFSISIGVGHSFSNLVDAKVSYREALLALQERVYEGKNAIIFYDEYLRAGKQEQIIMPTNDERDLINYVKSMDKAKIHVYLKEKFAQFKESRLPFEDVQTNCIKWLFQSVSQLEQMGIRIPDTCEDLKFPHDIVGKIETLDHLEKWLISQYLHMVQLISAHQESSYKNIVSVAMRYVDEHYAEKLKLEDIAEIVHVTPNYFSRIFKEETGDHFTRWLNHFRIEKAKGLLEQIGLKIYEISDMVGYTDYKYFSQIFKKETGHTPKQYRDLLD